MKDWIEIKDSDYLMPISRAITCRVCDITCNTGLFFDGKNYPSDMDSNVHSGFTIGRGKTLYWEICWTNSGNAIVYSDLSQYGRWISGDAEITIHWK